MATADVVVRSPTGGRFVCQRRKQDPTAWLCGRCDRGLLVAPGVGSRCPVCQADVVALRESANDTWFIATLVMLGLALGWLALVFWR